VKVMEAFQVLRRLRMSFLHIRPSVVTYKWLHVKRARHSDNLWIISIRWYQYEVNYRSVILTLTDKRVSFVRSARAAILSRLGCGLFRWGRRTKSSWAELTNHAWPIASANEQDDTMRYRSHYGSPLSSPYSEGASGHKMGDFLLKLCYPSGSI